MKSRTKNLISQEQIKELMKVNFGDDCRIGNIAPLKGGMFNSAYLIERVNEKDKIVLKVSVVPGARTLTYEQDLMPAEVAVYKLVTEKTSIPVPNILACDFSKKYIPSNYFFMTALEGEPMSKVINKLSKDNLEQVKEELAGYFAQLHQIKGEYFGYFTQTKQLQYRTWKEAFLNMMEMLLKDGKEHGIKLPYERYEKVLTEKSAYLETVKEPSLIDYDLWPGNIFLIKDRDKYFLEGIIDFERAFWGDPLADFPPAFMLIKDLHKEAKFWKAYKEKSNFGRDLTKDDDIRLAFYGLYLFTIMMVETFRYGYLYGKMQKAFSKIYAMKYLKALELA